VTDEPVTDDDAKDEEGSARRSRRMRWLLRAVVAVAVLFGALQLVPYGRDHDNPPVTMDAPWPDEETRRLAVDACYDCHSNETDWPFYSWIAPMSWLVTRDVEQGRDELNFSRWDDDPDADDAAEAIADGSMPPTRYVWLHPDADLDDAEAQRLIDALQAMDEAEDDDGGNSGPGGGGDDDD
jgi:hypothetical protein